MDLVASSDNVERNIYRKQRFMWTYLLLKLRLSSHAI